MMIDPKALLTVLIPVLLVSCLAMGAAPQPLLPVPTKAQLAWQRGELSLFLHFGVNTFTGREWGDGKEDPRIFNPTKLDARQWAAAAKAGGFKLAILTAKHHDGFCLWPSKYTDHCVKSSPWKDGKGDVVREFVDAFREQGIQVGLYLSPWDRHEKTYADSPEYNKYYLNQLTELLTNYGPIAEVWFDGACGEGPNGKRQKYDFEAYWALVHKLQPDAVMFSDAGPEVRWIGNEQGTAGDPCWATVDAKIWVEPGKAADGVRDPISSLQHGNKGGGVWRPAESDVSIRPGWFWHKKEDDKVRSVSNLVDLYFKSVGRNSLLLLNVPPNNLGLLADTDVKRLAEFKAKLDEIFKTDLARGKKAAASNTRGGETAFAADNAFDGDDNTYWTVDDGLTECWLEVDLGAKVKFNTTSLQEAIELGQRVAKYRVEYWDGAAWKLASRGTTIGHKKLDRFAPVESQKVRLVIEEAIAGPVISGLGVYDGVSESGNAR